MRLTEFLLQRVAEDEAVARGLMDRWTPLGHDFGPGIDTTVWGEPMEPDPWLEASEEYPVVNVHPLRVLAECEAKRQIVCRHTSCDDTSFGDPCEDLRSIALPYTDHPDYRQEWRQWRQQ